MEAHTAEFHCMVNESHNQGGGDDLKSQANGINLRNLDTKLTAKVTRCVLRTALDLAYSNRWIADWLFPSSNTTHPPLSPEAFENGLAIHMSSTLSSPMNYGKVREMIMNKETDLLVVPVCKMGHTTAGYTFCTGKKYEQLTGHQPVTHVAGDFLMSRFIYTTTRRQFLVVSPMPSDGVVGILQHTFHYDGSVERNFITTPFLHYSADFLPKAILTSQCNLETRDLSTSPNPDATASAAFEPRKAPAPTSKDLFAGAQILAPNTLPNLNQSMDDLLNELTSNGQGEQGKLFSPGVAVDDVYNFGGGSNQTSSGSSSEVRAVPFSAGDSFAVDLGAGDPTFDQFLAGEEEDYFDPTLPQRWNFNADGTTDDGVGIPRKPGGSSSTCSGAFDMSELRESLTSLEKEFKGHFFCLRAKSDRIDPNTGELLSRRSGQLVSAVTALDPMTTIRLRTIAAQSYYGTTLSPKIDSPLYTAAGGVLPPTFSFTTGTSSALPLVSNGNITFNSTSVHPNNPHALIAPPPAARSGAPMTITATNNNTINNNATTTTTTSTTMRSLRPGNTTNTGNGRPLNLLAPRLVLPAMDMNIQTPAPLADTRVASGRERVRSEVDKAELKKIRNRLSAAKSNQRRRIQLEAQRKELENLQMKVVELEKVKKNRAEENARLRQQLFGLNTNNNTTTAPEISF